MDPREREEDEAVMQLLLESRRLYEEYLEIALLVPADEEEDPEMTCERTWEHPLGLSLRAEAV